MTRKNSATRPKAVEMWIIESAGTAKYIFLQKDEFEVVPTPRLLGIKIPDATPELIARYAQSDEQALLAKVRYLQAYRRAVRRQRPHSDVRTGRHSRWDSNSKRAPLQIGSAEYAYGRRESAVQHDEQAIAPQALGDGDIAPSCSKTRL